MTKRRLLRWSLLLLIFAAFAVWLEPTRVVWGWLRGEAFYQGRPTSWWAGQIRPWILTDNTADDLTRQCKSLFDRIFAMRDNQQTSNLREFEVVYLDIDLFPQPSPFRDWIAKRVSMPRPTWPRALDGDSAAEAVLQELQTYDEPLLRGMARIGIERLKSSVRGPVVPVRLELHVPPSTSSIRMAIFDAVAP